MTKKHNFLIILSIILLIICYKIKEILTPFFLAMIIAYIFDPIIDFLETKKLSRSISIFLIIGILLIIIIIFLSFILPLFIKESLELINTIPSILKKIINSITSNRYILKFLPKLKANSNQLLTELPGFFGNFHSFSNSIINSIKSSIAFISNLVIFFIAAFYFLKDFDLMKAKIGELLPSEYKSEILNIMFKIHKLLQSFFQGQLLVCTILAILNSIALGTIGLNFSLVIGVLAGYLNIIPYFGVSLGILVSLAVSFFQFYSGLHLLYVLLAFGIVQTIDGILVTPRILGNKVGLSPILIIFFLLACGKLLGFLGILLAVPIACILKVFFLEILKKYKDTYISPSENEKNKKK